MSKVCKISNKKPNNGYSVSHSHIRTKKKQNVNLQNKKIWSTTQKCWLKMKLSTKVIKSLYKIKL
uniref:Large ribosomal subunit protein bL28c n=1 Tax=Thuretia quercifolia TaxID=189650 RepID=A0A1Z1MKR8_9FLOR|nr:ribosomal protein L28 [Thuretia quercifolia]ARW66395.1 ribosomal protein L28 [Thuretia quercifolia]